MRKITALLMASAGLPMLATGAYADTFVNGSFETGDLQGWTTGGGYWTGGAYPVPSDYLPGGPQFDATIQNNSVTTPGFDVRTDNQLRTAYAGNHSAQVNNPVQDYSVSVLSQRVNNYSDPIIAFAYSAVLEQSHDANDSDAFIITLTDVTTNESLFSFNLNSATAPGTFTQSSQGWYYTDWLTQSIDVSGRQGHDFVLSLLANDCPYGGHAGYAYLDGFGSVVGGGGTGNPPSTGNMQYWDGGAAGNAGNGIVDGGSGTWDATATNWTDAAGASNGVYTPNPGSAIFAGTPGTVTVDDSRGQVGVNGIQFAVDGYHIVGDAIDLGGTVATMQVGDGTAAGASYIGTIDAPLTGVGGVTKTDLGTLVLGGVNTYTGTTTVVDGALIGSATSFGSGAINNNATLIVDQPTDADFANRLMGAGTFAKAGAGTLRLTSISPFVGATQVLAGTLQADGTLDGSAVTVQSGATLAGAGTVGAVSVLDGGTIAPGTAGTIGTLNLNGGITQAANSTYAVDLTSAGASDLVGASGPATLTTGAKLVVTKTDAPRYVLGRRYTVVDAAGGATGSYAVSGDTNVSLFYNLVAAYDPTHVYLDVAQTRSFASAGGTPNQIAAAGGADSTAGTLHDAIGYLQTQSEARSAFDLLSGEIHATARAAAYEDSRFLREAVIDHLEHPTGRDLWFHAFGSLGRMRGDGNAARWRRDIGGIFVGADAIQSGALRIGVLGGYSHSKLKLPARLSTADADDAHVGAYAGLDGPLALKAGASYTFRMLKTDRSVGFTGFNDRLRARYTLGIAQAFGEVGARLGTGASTFEPFGQIAYVHLDSGHDAELGGVARLDMKARRTSVFFSTLGVKGDLALSSGEGTAFALKGSAGWRRAFSNRGTLATFAFASGGSDFTVAAPPIAKNVAALALGGEARLTSGTTISLSYSGQIGDRLADHGAKASISIPF